MYLLQRGIYGEPKEITKDEFWELSETERDLIDPQIEDGVYTIKTPREVTSEEMAEIISIQISEDISKIKKYAKTLCGIIVSSFILSIFAAIYTAISIASVL